MHCSSDSESDEGEWDLTSRDPIETNIIEQTSREFQDQPLILISGPSVQNIPEECLTDTISNEKRFKNGH